MLKRLLEKILAVAPVWLQMTTSFAFNWSAICHTPLATADESAIVLSRIIGSRASGWVATYFSVVSALWAMINTAPMGNFPIDVSPLSITESVPSKSALAMWLTYARVG